jgi:hypothetical protein
MDGLITLRRTVISLVLAACLVGLGYGLSLSRSTNKPVIYSDPAVKVLTPEPGDLALRQATIGVTLAPAFTLAQATSPGFSISTGGQVTPIPQDQLDIIPGLNQYFFTPGPGKDVTQLQPGRNCVTLHIKRADDPSDQGHSFSWCFESH